MAIDRGRIEAAVAELLAAIGEDATRSGLQQTPERVADSYEEFFGGLELDPVEPLRESVPLGDSEVSLSTPLLFDIGVFFAVFGTVSAILFALEQREGES